MLKVGHRGACGHEPENTLRSFHRAMELGADMVELDVHICGSGEIVVIHDRDVDRTTDGTGPVAGKTLEGLKLLDAGKGEAIPTLQEVLDRVNRRVKLDIELKGEGTAGPVSRMLREYISEKGWSYDDFLITSFRRDELDEFSVTDGRFYTGIIVHDIAPGLVELMESIKASSAAVHYKSLTGEFLKTAKNRNLGVFAWTVNKRSDIERMKQAGVDGIISDFPDRI